MKLMRWIRALWDRFRPAEVPQGWDVESLDEIRPRWNEPLTGEIPTVEQTGPVIVVDEHLGTLFAADMKPSRAWLFEATRELHPVDLSWRPGWLDGLVTV